MGATCLYMGYFVCVTLYGIICISQRIELSLIVSVNIVGKHVFWTRWLQCLVTAMFDDPANFEFTTSDNEQQNHAHMRHPDMAVGTWMCMWHYISKPLAVLCWKLKCEKLQPSNLSSWEPWNHGCECLRGIFSKTLAGMYLTWHETWCINIRFWDVLGTYFFSSPNIWMQIYFCALHCFGFLGWIFKFGCSRVCCITWGYCGTWYH